MQKLKRNLGQVDTVPQLKIRRCSVLSFPKQIIYHQNNHLLSMDRD